MQIISSPSDGLPLASVYRRDDLLGGLPGRTDFNQPPESLQVALIINDVAVKYRDHKHIPNNRSFDLTQESWFVLKGTVRVSLFDVDDTLVPAKPPVVLNSGDLLLIHRGGHGYYGEAGHVVLEFKSGPFVGTECDKVLL